jgi:hypothetical protein
LFWLNNNRRFGFSNAASVRGKAGSVKINLGEQYRIWKLGGRGWSVAKLGDFVSWWLIAHGGRPGGVVICHDVGSSDVLRLGEPRSGDADSK